MTSQLHDLDWAGLEILDADDCFAELDRAPVGRLGFVDHGEPVILPVNFAVDGRSLVFRTAAGSKLSAAIMAQPVCVEVDDWDERDRSGWSVVAKGVADQILDADEIARLERLAVRPWSRPDLRAEWVRILVEEVTGRRISPPAPAGDRGAR